MSVKKLAVFVPILIVCILCSCTTNRVSDNDTFFAMNTIMSVEAPESPEAVNEIRAYIAGLDREVSHTSSDSLLWKINNRSDDSVLVCGDLFQMLSSSLSLSEITGGAFDITVQGAAALWDIGGENQRIPSEREIAQAKLGIGYEKLSLKENTLSLPAGTQITFGGIAKGYASLKAKEILDKYDVKEALVNLGGNIYVRGTEKKIGVRDPDGTANDYIAIIDAKDEFLISSGDYERFFIEDGVRYHHIIDPKTGKPARSDLRSVLIICDDGTRADAYSTALFVMGSDAALDFYRQTRNFEAVLICDSGKIIITPGIADRFRTTGGREYEVAQG